jgi:hypothetical protein
MSPWRLVGTFGFWRGAPASESGGSMTRHTSRSTTGSGRRAAVGLLALVFLLGGCSSPPVAVPTATPTPTPTATPAEIAAEIAATFPTEAEWLESYETGELCTAEIAGMTSCGYEVIVPSTSSSGKGLREGVTAVTAAVVALNVSEFESGEVAEEWAEKSRAADVLFNGEFDIPADTATRVAGSRGTGNLVEFSRADWAGYRMSQVSETTGYDGSASGPATSTDSITLTNGPLRFSLSVYYASAAPGVADAEVEGWLDRVFGPETSD